MAESTLGTTYTELREEIASYLGLSRTEGNWSVTDKAKIAVILKRALRQFYFPPKVGQDEPHEWSFLKPVTTMVTIAPYSTGTIAVTITGTTVTLTDGVWPAWTATHGSLVVDTTEYVIATRTDDTHLELASAWTEDTETEAEFTLKHDGDYDLPDDYGGMEGELVIESENYKPNIVLVGEGRIRSLRQMRPQNNITSGTSTPYYAAIRPLTHSVTTTGQRFEIMFYPLPNAVYTLSFVMRVLPQMLVDTTIEYPYGGTMHAETLLAACLSVAEEQENGNRRDGDKTYDKNDLFKERLAASIGLDRQVVRIDYYGYNRDNSDAVHRDDPRSRHHRGWRGDNLVTYDPV